MPAAEGWVSAAGAGAVAAAAAAPADAAVAAAATAAISVTAVASCGGNATVLSICLRDEAKSRGDKLRELDLYGPEALINIHNA